MAKPVTTLTVLRTERLTPHMVRVWLGGDEFAAFRPAGGQDGHHDTDMYVKIVFAPEGVDYPRPVDMDAIRDTYPAEQQPILRTYTVRHYRPDAAELAIDFVVHGDEGVAGPWAAGVRPGESVTLLGPGSGYRPIADAPWHLLVSDEAGLPALAAALEAMPQDAVAKVFIEVAGPEDEVELTAPAGAEITWVHRGAPSNEAPDDRSGDNAPVIAAVRAAQWLDGEPQVFIHGEAQAVMKNLRGYVRKERGVSAKRAASISGYWRRGRTEEGFRQWKAELRKAESHV
ncbi:MULTISPECIES: siderophore-interacting protein [Gordonia]|uniref:Putative siderophore-interacting protein n=1 Tax=Gordonia sihwensis NBRC 108236 TaxID=1223544 RepID=L7LNQ2_9ACTN|nr:MULTISPECIES: siderophore-interacting protein [Gordonia]AUH69292.1 siderophore-interacting protein [Gordonia sp. YC-JH1]MBY4569842.1 siderophore-interacting protein [Gordonia sihwensis]GAC62489.1 putative siderophore-interacting protein [Gordonia sihwensis NBRC 108236]